MPTHRTASRLLWTLPLAVSAALAAPVTTLTGPIKDWTPGETGEVQLALGNLATNNLDFLQSIATAAVDAKGQFTLKLPAASVVKPALLPASTSFKLNVPCTGTLKATPAAALNFFDLSNYDSFGLRVSTMRRGSTATSRLTTGDTVNLLVYASTPTRLTGSSRCEPNASGRNTSESLEWNWNAELTAGWNMLTVRVGPPKNLVSQAVVTAEAQPANTWYRFTGFGGLGMYAADNGKGQVLLFGISMGSTAEQAGLRNSDIVLAIDGVSAKGLTYNQVAERIRGEVGTQVALKVLRGTQELTITATREFVRSN